MGFRLDLHVHTRAHSPCSRIDPEKLIDTALDRNLDGLVITEHAVQWAESDLAALAARAGAPSFVLLAGFEYASRRGDLLVYGLSDARVRDFPPNLSPADAVRRIGDLGGVCIAAHPTRCGLGFDEELLGLPVDAIEVASSNLQPHEQRLALRLAELVGKPGIAASDAHALNDVGRYATVFDDPVRSVADLQAALRNGRFVGEGVMPRGQQERDSAGE
ncbi:MAG TPA: PHP domain-containing protein [Candidatus Hydrogenedentes bacterium]|nr:PHP domain-containing protein [Candidatus Hydrogenedentota bacterium]HPG66445.1 PHP domain-containing protein [Candidatus Hydrogenedentota bacterium]